MRLCTQQASSDCEDGRAAFAQYWTPLKDSECFASFILRTPHKKKARVALATLASLSPCEEAGKGSPLGVPTERISRRSREHRATIGV